MPPHRAVWVPPGVPHAVRYPGAVTFRGVLIAPELCAGLPGRVGVMQVDPLARELIRAVATTPWDQPPDGPEARLGRVLIDRLVALPIAPLALPDCLDERLRPIVEVLGTDPADDRGLAQWAALVALSPRSLARRFRAATGMSLGQWRQQLRLLRAVERLALGQPVTTVALDLGYETPAGFGAMFKRATGRSPGAYLDG